jgi:hypothetical protein
LGIGRNIGGLGLAEDRNIGRLDLGVLGIGRKIGRLERKIGLFLGVLGVKLGVLGVKLGVLGVKLGFFWA